MEKRQIIESLLSKLCALTEYSLEDMVRFLIERQDCWMGLSALQMVDIGKGDSVIRFLDRLNDGDPIS